MRDMLGEQAGLKRRAFIAAGAAAAAVGAVVVTRPGDQGAGGHDAYFSQLSAALREAGIASPTLVIDRARLDANIAAVKQAVGARHAVRVVAKSLPSPKLLDAVMDGVGTPRAMVFNGATLEQVGAARPQADLLLGKPLPAMQVADFVKRHAGDEAPSARHCPRHAAPLAGEFRNRCGAASRGVCQRSGSGRGGGNGAGGEADRAQRADGV